MSIEFSKKRAKICDPTIVLLENPFILIMINFNHAQALMNSADFQWVSKETGRNRVKNPGLITAASRTGPASSSTQRSARCKQIDQRCCKGRPQTLRIFWPLKIPLPRCDFTSVTQFSEFCKKKPCYCNVVMNIEDMHPNSGKGKDYKIKYYFLK